MKILIKIFLLTILTGSFAQAGVTGRALRSAMKAAEKRSTIIVDEFDIMKKMRVAQMKARGDMTAKTIIMDTKLSRLDSRYRVEIQGNTEFARTPNKRLLLSFDVKGIDSATKRRIKTLINDNDWSLVGHFDHPQIKKYVDTGDGFELELEITGVNSMNLDNVRGIRKLIDNTFKVANEAQRTIPTATFSRKGYSLAVQASK